MTAEFLPFQNNPKLRKIVFYIISAELIWVNGKKIYQEINEIIRDKQDIREQPQPFVFPALNEQKIIVFSNQMIDKIAFQAARMMFLVFILTVCYFTVVDKKMLRKMTK